MAQSQDRGRAPWRSLFAPDERLGWVFNDRSRMRRAFAEPEPGAGTGPAAKTAHEAAVEQKLPGRLVWTWKIAAAGLVVGLVWRARTLARTNTPLSLGSLALVAAAVGIGAGAAWVALIYGHRRAVRAFWDGRRETHARRAGAVHATWIERRSAFEAEEDQRLTTVSEWTSAQVAPGSRRIDVIGGNLWSWEAFLTVFGSSTLTARGPVLVVDLSGEVVTGELTRGAAERGLDVDVQLLPAQLPDSDLVAGMDTGQLVEVFVEALHGGQENADRGERGMDTRILTAVCQALTPGGLTMDRIAAGMRVLMGEPASDGLLNPAERAYLADELFSEEYRRQAFASLRRIEALAHPLGPLGAAASPRTAATLRCVAMSNQWRSGGADFLADLVVAWAAREVADPAGRVATLVIAGADELAVRHIERLSDLCDRRGVRLVTMFRHLRETSLRVLGAGPVGFMKLGNHEEAARAADYIGREHRFELSQLTHSVGGEQTHALADSSGGSSGFTRAEGREHSGSRQDLIGPRTHGWSESQSRAWSSERTWGSTVSAAEGANWSDTSSERRVYEHSVDPRTLQQLPDYAMVLVEHSPGGVRVRAVDINPEIALLTEGAPAPDSAQEISVYQYTNAVPPPAPHRDVESAGRPEIPAASGRLPARAEGALARLRRDRRR